MISGRLTPLTQKVSPSNLNKLKSTMSFQLDASDVKATTSTTTKARATVSFKQFKK